jgi:hypothetical protein
MILSVRIRILLFEYELTHSNTNFSRSYTNSPVSTRIFPVCTRILPESTRILPESTRILPKVYEFYPFVHEFSCQYTNSSRFTHSKGKSFLSCLKTMNCCANLLNPRCYLNTSQPATCVGGECFALLELGPQG